jgi:release factor glutamine methyltransferase
MNDLQPEVKDYEDHKALHGGNDGLNIIRDIIINSPYLLRKDGPKEIWMEVSSSHIDMIEEWMKQPGIHSRHCIFIDKIIDLNGKSRFVRLKSTLN